MKDSSQSKLPLSYSTVYVSNRLFCVSSKILFKTGVTSFTYTFWNIHLYTWIFSLSTMMNTKKTINRLRNSKVLSRRNNLFINISMEYTKTLQKHLIIHSVRIVLQPWIIFVSHLPSTLKIGRSLYTHIRLNHLY